MEDKKVKAGSVAVGICLLIIAVLLFGIVLIFYKWNNEKIILQSKIISLENELKEKVEVKEEIKNKENVSNEDLEKMAKELLDKYMKLDKYEDYAVGPMANILIELGFEDEKEFMGWLLNQPAKFREIIKTNVKYDEFKKALLEYMTENYRRHPMISLFHLFPRVPSGHLLKKMNEKPLHVHSQRKPRYVK